MMQTLNDKRDFNFYKKKLKNLTLSEVFFAIYKKLKYDFEVSRILGVIHASKRFE